MSTGDPGEDLTLVDPSSIIRTATEMSNEAISLAQTGNPTNIDRAIDLLQEAHDILSNHMLYSTAILANLTCVLWDRYVITDSGENLELGISIGNDVLELTEARDIDLPYENTDGLRLILMNLGRMHHARYDHQTDLGDLAAAISCTTSALSLSGGGYLFEDDGFSDLGDWHFTMYEQTGDVEDLDSSIKAYANASLHIPPEHPDRGSLNVAFAEALMAKFEHTNDPTSLDGSIRVMQEAVRATRQEDPSRPERLAILAWSLWIRFDLKEGYEDRDNAIRALEEAIELADARPDQVCTPKFRSRSLGEVHKDTQEARNPQETDDNTDVVSQRSSLMGQLAGYLLERYERASANVDLDRSIILFSKAKELCPTHAKLYIMILKSYTKCLQYRFQLTNDIEDINLSITVEEEYLTLLPEGHPERLEQMMRLAVNITKRFSRLKKTQDIDRAQALAEQVLDEASPAHSQRASWLSTYGNIVGQRFSDTHDLKHLDDAVRLTREAVELMSDADSKRPHQLWGYGYRLAERFGLTADMNDLSKAIEMMDESVKTTADARTKNLRQIILGQWLAQRFERMGDMRDLSYAIELVEEMVAGPNAQDATSLNILAYCYSARYQRDGDFEDLDKSIEALQRGLGDKNSKETNPDLSIQLAVSFCLRGKDRNRQADVDYSIQKLDQVLETLPEQSRHRSRCLYILGQALQLRYVSFNQDFKSTQDIDRSIQALTEIQASLNLEHLDAAMRFQLGTSYRARYELNENPDPADRQQALGLFQECFGKYLSPPLDRIEGAMQAADLLNSMSRPQEAADILKQAMSLLPALSLRSLATQDQQQVLRKIVGLASMTAAMALQSASDLYDALLLLESGRGVIASLLNETRMDMSMLEADVASELLEARHAVSALQSASKVSLSSIDINGEVSLPPRDADFKSRHAAEARLLAIIEKIQSNPETRGFLQPPSQAEIMELLDNDTIIIINASVIRCDAFLINRQDGVRLVELKKLNLSDINSQAQSLRSSRPYINLSLLEWLWDYIASPILERLGLGGPCENVELPRLFWILTGPLTQLPIHAAGRHTDGSKQTVMDKAISSYCLSLRNFVYGRKAKPLRLQDQTRDAVLAKLVAQIFHYAGHGRSNPFDPSQSGLVLEDALLTVSDLQGHTMADKMPFLGYLSACFTAANDVQDLVDEGIHLLGACQLAGFRHLIGALWQVHDDACVKMAELVYDGLAAEGMTDQSVCASLHNALVRFRDTWVAEQNSTATRCLVKSSSCDSNGLSADISREGNADQWAIDDRDGQLNLKRSVVRGVIKADWVPYVHFGP
ncbi:hypothetical protein IL306_000094 [Fusarium sp. DS 682]|nr:hypothetical protein IL306_000094 [Fusarium sp. DS 682]